MAVTVAFSKEDTMRSPLIRNQVVYVTAQGDNAMINSEETRVIHSVTEEFIKQSFRKATVDSALWDKLHSKVR